MLWSMTPARAGAEAVGLVTVIVVDIVAGAQASRLATTNTKQWVWLMIRLSVMELVYLPHGTKAVLWHLWRRPRTAFPHPQPTTAFSVRLHIRKKRFRHEECGETSGETRGEHFPPTRSSDKYLRCSPWFKGKTAWAWLTRTMLSLAVSSVENPTMLALRHHCCYADAWQSFHKDKASRSGPWSQRSYFRLAMAQIMLISFSRLENGQPYGKAYTRVSSIVFYLFISTSSFLFSLSSFFIIFITLTLTYNYNSLILIFLFIKI